MFCAYLLRNLFECMTDFLFILVATPFSTTKTVPALLCTRLPFLLFRISAKPTTAKNIPRRKSHT